ncbi:MAG: response regulator [Candidatus Omnitrophota bacterium]
MGPKILIVDDEADVCKNISHFLEKKDFTPITAYSGKEALEKLEKENPNLILLDIRMPDMDGVECLKQIRQYNKEVIVIMVTCVTDIDIAKKALELGAIDYITKPIAFEALQTAISTYLFLKDSEKT